MFFQQNIKINQADKPLSAQKTETIFALLKKINKKASNSLG